MPHPVNGDYPAPRSPRYQTLDAWRGVACLMVVIYHATIITCATRPETGTGVAYDLVTFTHQLSAGVPMFFVISGYCISAAADSARRREHSVRTYFWRRFRRIYPPLWAIIAAGIVLFLTLDYVLFPGVLSNPPWAQFRPWWFSGWQWCGNLTLTETWRHYLIGNHRGHFPGQAWTLCYEEQFYALTGLMLLVAGRRFFTGGLVVTGAVGLAMAISSYQDIAVDGFFFDGSWLTFAAGMVVYYQSNYAGRTMRWCLNAVLAVAALLTWCRVVAIPGGEVAFPFALLISLAHRFDVHTARVRFLVPFAFCGQMCYSLYLVHELPVKAISHSLHQAGVISDQATLLLTVPMSVAVCVFLGWLFYLAVERRFLNNPRPVLASVGIQQTGECDTSISPKRLSATTASTILLAQSNANCP